LGMHVAHACGTYACAGARGSSHMLQETLSPAVLVVILNLTEVPAQSQSSTSRTSRGTKERGVKGARATVAIYGTQPDTDVAPVPMWATCMCYITNITAVHQCWVIGPDVIEQLWFFVSTFQVY